MRQYAGAHTVEDLSKFLATGGEYAGRPVDRGSTGAEVSSPALSSTLVLVRLHIVVLNKFSTAWGDLLSFKSFSFSYFFTLYIVLICVWFPKGG